MVDRRIIQENPASAVRELIVAIDRPLGIMICCWLWLVPRSLHRVPSGSEVLLQNARNQSLT